MPQALLQRLYRWACCSKAFARLPAAVDVASWWSWWWCYKFTKELSWTKQDTSVAAIGDTASIGKVRYQCSGHESMIDNSGYTGKLVRLLIFNFGEHGETHHATIRCWTWALETSYTSSLTHRSTSSVPRTGRSIAHCQLWIWPRIFASRRYLQSRPKLSVSQPSKTFGKHLSSLSQTKRI